MIYLPSHFEAKDRAQSYRLIRENPFATLVSFNQGSPVISHLPVLIQREETEAPLIEGHMATRNPHADVIADGDEVTVIFHGPHTYITPTWYAENDVPTWNYAVVHARGKIRWVRDAKPLIALLRRATDFFEAGSTEPWKFYLPEDLKSPDDLTAAIVGFEITVASIEAKFKFSQNRSLEDKHSVIRGLSERADEKSARVAQMMEELL